MEEKELKKELKEEKKSNAGLKVVIIILVLALLGTVGYITYDKGLIKIPKKQQSTEEIKTDDTKHDKELSQGEIDDLNDMAKEISSNFAQYYPLTDFSKLDNQELLNWALERIGFKEIITEKEMEDEIKGYFGNQVKIKHEDIECPTSDDQPLYLYEDGGYVPNPNHFGHGVTTPPQAAVFYVSGEKEGKTITANYKILYSNTCSDTCFLSSYYKSYEDAVKGINALLEGDPDSPEGPGVNLTEELFKTVEVRVPVTTFKVEKTDKGYILRSVEVHE